MNSELEGVENVEEVEKKTPKDIGEELALQALAEAYEAIKVARKKVSQVRKAKFISTRIQNKLDPCFRLLGKAAGELQAVYRLMK
jgi:hypothetical protein